MTAHYQIHPEAAETCLKAIREFTEYVKNHEPGTQMYTALQETGQTSRFLHIFIFENEVARQIHSNSEGVKRFTEILYPETMNGVEFKEYVLVSSL